MNKIYNKSFTYISKDNSVKIIVSFKQGFPLKHTHLGKTYAKRTECSITINGFLKAFHFVTKHEKDNDSVKHAYLNSFRPICDHVYSEAKVDIIKQILEYAKTN